MNSDINNENRSRYEQRSKRKKTNLILNGLIIIVILLIVYVSYTIFSTNDKNADNQQGNKSSEQQAGKDQETSGQVSEDDDEGTSEEQQTDDTDEVDGDAIITEGGSDSNVIRTIENPSWQPVGTTQTGEHRASYTEGVDWDEQLKALAYATGLDVDNNMTVWFLGNNNKDPQKSIGTVSSSDKNNKYRVYIEWVDGEGWKPTKVEEIKDLNIR